MVTWDKPPLCGTRLSRAGRLLLYSMCACVSECRTAQASLHVCPRWGSAMLHISLQSRSGTAQKKCRPSLGAHRFHSEVSLLECARCAQAGSKLDFIVLPCFVGLLAFSAMWQAAFPTHFGMLTVRLCLVCDFFFFFLQPFFFPLCTLVLAYFSLQGCTIDLCEPWFSLSKTGFLWSYFNV